MIFKCIESLEENSTEIFLEVSLVLMKLIDNILLYPSNPKYRKLRLENATVSRLLIPAIGAMECLFEIGFEEGDDSLLLPSERTSVEKLTQFRNEISSRRSKYLTDNSNSPAATITTTTTTTTTTITNNNNNNSNNSLSTSSCNTSSNNNSKVQVNSAAQCSQVSKKKIQGPAPAGSVPPLIQKMYILSDRILQCEDTKVKARALSLIPLDRLNITIQTKMTALEEAALEGKEPLNKASAHEMLYLLEVVTWFKNEFFKWVDTPECVQCNGNTTFVGLSTNPTNFVNTNRVEVYKCQNCSGQTLFPRLNDVKLLLDSRKGRCGEWAQTFTLICHALGWETRYIYDETDHAWNETVLSRLLLFKHF